jgi:hypothetical protein
MALPEMKQVPPGCETVEFVISTFATRARRWRRVNGLPYGVWCSDLVAENCGASRRLAPIDRDLAMRQLASSAWAIGAAPSEAGRIPRFPVHPTPPPGSSARSHPRQANGTCAVASRFGEPSSK